MKMQFQINPYSMLIGVGFTINNLFCKSFWGLNASREYTFLGLSFII